MIPQRRGHEHPLVAAPRSRMLGHGEVDLERDRLLRLPSDELGVAAVFPRDLAQRVRAVGGEEPLEIELVLAVRRRVQLGLDVGPKSRILESLRHHSSEFDGAVRPPRFARGTLGSEQGEGPLMV